MGNIAEQVEITQNTPQSDKLHTTIAQSILNEESIEELGKFIKSLDSDEVLKALEFKVCRDKEIKSLIAKASTLGYNTYRKNIQGIEFTGIDILQNVQIITSKAIVIETANSLFRCTNFRYIDISEINFSECNSMRSMFEYCSNLESIAFGEYINTNKLEDISMMFSNCHKLKEIDMSKFNTSKVKNMTAMFNNCKSLKYLDLSNFNTYNVTAMSYMFYECLSLKNLNISSFDVHNVLEMCSMFDKCEALIELDINNFNTEKLRDASEMFSNCTSLEKLKISNFNTSSIENMSYMFYKCQVLKSIDVSNFNTSKVVYLEGMFSNCKSLNRLDLSNFNTSKVASMALMFNECEALKVLDISNFELNHIEEFGVNSLFRNCKSLEKVYMQRVKSNNLMKSILKSCTAQVEIV